MAAHELLQPLGDDRGIRGARDRAGGRRGSTPIPGATSTPSSGSPMRVRLLVEALLAERDERAASRLRRRAGRSVRSGPRLPRSCSSRRSRLATRELDVDPMPVVQGNPVLLSGVFGNLLSNALKYGPRSGAEIQVSAVRSEAGLDVRRPEPGPADPGRRERADLRAVAARPGERRARGAGPRVSRSSAISSSATAARSGSLADRREQPLLLHAAGLSARRRRLRPSRRACAARRRPPRRENGRPACAGCSSRASGRSRSRARVAPRSAPWSARSASSSITSHSRGVSGDSHRAQAAGPSGARLRCSTSRMHSRREIAASPLSGAEQRARQHVDLHVLGEEPGRRPRGDRSCRSRRPRRSSA